MSSAMIRISASSGPIGSAHRGTPRSRAARSGSSLPAPSSPASRHHRRRRRSIDELDRLLPGASRLAPSTVVGPGAEDLAQHLGEIWSRAHSAPSRRRSVAPRPRRSGRAARSRSRPGRDSAGCDETTRTALSRSIGTKRIRPASGPPSTTAEDPLELLDQLVGAAHFRAETGRTTCPAASRRRRSRPDLVSVAS